MTNEFVAVKVRPVTRNALRLLAAMRRQRMWQTVAELVSAALHEEQKRLAGSELAQTLVEAE